MAISPVRVVCVTYNSGNELHEFARSLRTAAVAGVELVLVDNGADHTVPEQVALEHQGRLVVPARNLGYGGGANLGARGATGQWLVVSNPDVVWRPGSLDLLLAAAQRHPRAGAFGPALYTPEGELYPSARALPSLGLGIGHALLGRTWPGNPWSRAYLGGGWGRTRRADGERSVGWLSGACLLLRREAFEQVGGFDEGYFMFFEDLDLGARLGRAGWESVYVPAARITHVGGVSWRDRPAAMIAEHHASADRYVTGRYPHGYQRPLRAVLRLGLRARRRVALRAADGD